MYSFKLLRVKLTDEAQVKNKKDLVLASMLEWDHDDPLTKTKNVSQIFNNAERWLEIAKCTLRCIICHRFRTWKCGHTRRGGVQSERVLTREKISSWLEFKHARLKTNPNGECISYFDSCPMTTSIEKLWNKSQDDLKVVMIAYDFDHRDQRTKLGTVYHMRSEADKCDLRCCVCHKSKSLIEGDLEFCNEDRPSVRRTDE